MYIKLFENFENDIFDVIENIYFKSDKVSINKNTSYGYRVSNGVATFGCKLTTKADISYLFHEMGHFVYFKDYNRLLKNEYGLTYPQINVYGKDYDLVGNWTDIKNEVRVSCFQYMLLEHFKQNITFDEFVYDWISSLRLLDGITYVPVKNAIKKDSDWYDINTDTIIEYKNIEKRRIETIIDFFKEEYNNPKYNIDEFNNRWFDRVKFLENNL